MWLVVDIIVVVAVIVVIYVVICGSLNACRIRKCVKCGDHVAVVTLKVAPKLGHKFVLPEFRAMTTSMSGAPMLTRKCITCVPNLGGVTSSEVGGG